jgi:hypothetical protein
MLLLQSVDAVSDYLTRLKIAEIASSTYFSFHTFALLGAGDPSFSEGLRV